MDANPKNFLSQIKMVRARTPLRLSFGGGGTDVSPYADHARRLCAQRHDFALRLWDIGAEVGTLDRLSLLRLRDGRLLDRRRNISNFDGQMDLVKGVLKRFELDKFRTEGFDLFVHADAPPGSGLGSSSTFTVALIGLFRELLGLPITSDGMAKLAYDIERNDVGIKGGRQDQYAAAFGGFNFMEFNGEEVVVTPLRLSEYLINELEYNLSFASRVAANLSQSSTARWRARRKKKPHRSPPWTR